MAENAEQVTSFVLNHMKRMDMRPKEDFKKLDLVRISGGHITGRIMAFDADHRLAHVDSTIGLGWWYLKDLERLPLAKAQGSQRKPFNKTSNGEMDIFLFEGMFSHPSHRCHVLPFVEESV